MGDISVKEGMALQNEKVHLTIRLLSIFDHRRSVTFDSK